MQDAVSKSVGSRTQQSLRVDSCLTPTKGIVQGDTHADKARNFIGRGHPGVGVGGGVVAAG